MERTSHQMANVVEQEVDSQESVDPLSRLQDSRAPWAERKWREQATKRLMW